MPLNTLTPVTESLRTLLLRGLLAGLIAGLLGGVVAFALGEPHVQAAIEIEESAAPAEPDHHVGETAPHDHSAEAAEPEGHSHGDDALVSRTGQRFGLFLATTLAGLALGATFAVVVHYARRFTAMAGPPHPIGVAKRGTHHAGGGGGVTASAGAWWHINTLAVGRGRGIAPHPFIYPPTSLGG